MTAKIPSPPRNLNWDVHFASQKREKPVGRAETASRTPSPFSGQYRGEHENSFMATSAAYFINLPNGLGAIIHASLAGLVIQLVNDKGRYRS
jgi:hypothetical protein